MSKNKVIRKIQRLLNTLKLKRLLNKLESVSKEEGLGDFVDELLELLSDFNDRECRKILAQKTFELVKQEKIGATAALEVCGLINLTESLEAFEIALKEGNSDSLVTSIAAQRIRLLSVDKSKRPRYLGDCLRKHIDEWLDKKCYDEVATSLLSVAWLEGKESLPWLGEFVEKNLSLYLNGVYDEDSFHDVAGSAGMAIRSVQVIYDPTEDDNVGQKILSIACEVLNSVPSSENTSISLLRATFIDVAAAFSKWGPEEAAEIVANGFLKGGAIERAATLGSFRRLLEQIDGKVLNNLILMFNQHNAAAFKEFLYKALLWKSNR